MKSLFQTNFQKKRISRISLLVFVVSIFCFTLAGFLFPVSLFLTFLLLSSGIFFFGWGFRDYVQSPLEEWSHLLEKSDLKNSTFDSDTVEGWIGSVTSLLRDQKTEIQDLQKKESFLFSLLDSVMEGVVLIDPSGRILYSNPEFKKIFSFFSSPLSPLLIEFVRTPTLRFLIHQLRKGEKRVEGEITFQETDSDHKKNIQVVGLSSMLSQPVYWFLFREVTEIRYLEKIRKEFVENLSHEIKTPLTVMSGYLETVLDHPNLDPSERTDFLKLVFEQTHRLKKLFQEMLQLSEIESGRFSLSQEKIVFIDVIHEIKEDLQSELNRKNMTLQEENLDLQEVFFDKFSLRQIFKNLILNAILHGREGGKISVRFLSEKGKNILEVEDDGPGIPAEFLTKIFERFYRLDVSRNRQRGGGNGLGLSIVKHLAELNGARVEVKSEVEKGSLFRVILK